MVKIQFKALCLFFFYLSKVNAIKIRWWVPCYTVSTEWLLSEYPFKASTMAALSLSHSRAPFLHSTHTLSSRAHQFPRLLPSLTNQPSSPSTSFFLPSFLFAGGDSRSWFHPHPEILMQNLTFIGRFTLIRQMGKWVRAKSHWGCPTSEFELFHFS